MENAVQILNWAEGAILCVLVALSIWSISVMIDRRRVFKKALLADVLDAEKWIADANWVALKSWCEKEEGLAPLFIRTILQISNPTKESVEYVARSFISKERMRLEKGFNLLGTLGSNAPFIGLLGTVLGIMKAFSALSSEQIGSAQVMSAISEALLATAIGLFVAIPAVVAYNYFTSKLRQIVAKCDSLKNLYLSRIGNGR